MCPGHFGENLLWGLHFPRETEILPLIASVEPTPHQLYFFIVKMLFFEQKLPFRLSMTHPFRACACDAQSQIKHTKSILH